MEENNDAWYRPAFRVCSSLRLAREARANDKGDYMTGDLVTMLRSETVIPVAVAARAVGITRDNAYRAIRAGRLPSVRMGRAVRVPTAPLRVMLGIEASAA